MQTRSSRQKQPIDYSNRIWTVPNALSFFRLALIPLFCILYFSKRGSVAAVAVFAVSALTDIVDGFIARRFNMISNFGKALDPIADKMTQGIVLICLLTRFPYLAAVVVLLLVKEVVTGAVNLHIAKKTGVVNGAQWHGKLATVLLFATMFLHLAWRDIIPPVSYISVALCAAVMLMSFILYAIWNKKLLDEYKNR